MWALSSLGLKASIRNGTATSNSPSLDRVLSFCFSKSWCEIINSGSGSESISQGVCRAKSSSPETYSPKTNACASQRLMDGLDNRGGNRRYWARKHDRGWTEKWEWGGEDKSEYSHDPMVWPTIGLFSQWSWGKGKREWRVLKAVGSVGKGRVHTTRDRCAVAKPSAVLARILSSSTVSRARLGGPQRLVARL